MIVFEEVHLPITSLLGAILEEIYRHKHPPEIDCPIYLWPVEKSNTTECHNTAIFLRQFPVVSYMVIVPSALWKKSDQVADKHFMQATEPIYCDHWINIAVNSYTRT